MLVFNTGVCDMHRESVHFTNVKIRNLSGENTESKV